MRIAISSSVGCGKTALSKLLKLKLDFFFKSLSLNDFSEFDLIHLNDFAKRYKICEVKNLQTFDFDLDKLLLDFNLKFLKGDFKYCILESHFSHFFDPKFVDILVIINRDLKDLKLVYKNRGYNKEKQEGNLEVESFDLCYFQALENGFLEKDIIKVLNDSKLLVLVEKVFLEILNSDFFKEFQSNIKNNK